MNTPDIILVEFNQLTRLEDRVKTMPSGDSAAECVRVCTSIHRTIMRCVGMIERGQDIGGQLQYLDQLHRQAEKLINNHETTK